MIDMLAKLAIAAAIAYGCWTVIEIIILARFARKGPAGPVSGPEALKGRSAVVARPFEELDREMGLVGFVRVMGETWRARLIGSPARPPSVGDEVRIVDRDGLTVSVEVSERA